MSPRRRARVSQQAFFPYDRDLYASRRGEARLELYIELTGTLKTLEVALCRAMWCAIQLGIQRPHYIVQRIGRGSSSAYARFLFCNEEVRHALLDEYRLEEKQWVGRERWRIVRIERIFRGAGRHPAANSLHIYIFDWLEDFWKGPVIHRCLLQLCHRRETLCRHIASFLWPLRRFVRGFAAPRLRDVVRMTMYTCQVHIRLLNYVVEHPAERDRVLAPEYIDTWADQVKRTGWQEDALVVY